MGYTDTINRVLAGNYDEASDDEKEEAVGKVVTVCSVASAAVAVQPIYEQKKKEKQNENKSNESLKDKLTQLNQAREAGLLSDEELAQKKEELLASF